MTVGQGPTALAIGAGGGCLDIFTLICPFSPLSPSLWETARYRLKYSLKGPLNPKQPTNQPTGESHGGSHTWLFSQHFILCSDVNIMKLSLVMLVKPRVSLLQTLTKNHLNMKKTRYSNI